MDDPQYTSLDFYGQIGFLFFIFLHWEFSSQQILFITYFLIIFYVFFQCFIFHTNREKNKEKIVSIEHFPKLYTKRILRKRSLPTKYIVVFFKSFILRTFIHHFLFSFSQLNLQEKKNIIIKFVIKFLSNRVNLVKITFLLRKERFLSVIYIFLFYVHIYNIVI